MKVFDNNKQSTGLELEHIMPYTSYGLRFAFTKDYYYPYPAMQKKGFSFTFDLLETPKILYCGHVNKSWIDVILKQYYFKPIFRPLSDLMKEIEVDGEKFVPMDFLSKMFDLSEDYELRFKNNLFVLYDKVNEWYMINDNNFSLFQKLFEWHFNVFNLPQDLWIDINTLEKEKKDEAN